MSALHAYKAWCSNLYSHELQPFHQRHKITCEMVDVYYCIDPVLMVRSFEKRSARKKQTSFATENKIEVQCFKYTKDESENSHW